MLHYSNIDKNKIIYSHFIKRFKKKHVLQKMIIQASCSKYKKIKVKLTST